MHPSIVDRAVENRTGEVFTMQPGVVLSFTPATRKATIAPQILTPVLDGDRTLASVEAPPPIPDVPVLFPGGSGFELVWELAPGTGGALLHAHRDPSAWQATGAPAPPTWLTLHGATPALFIPGWYADPQALAVAPAAAVGGAVMRVPMPAGLRIGSEAATLHAVIVQTPGAWFSEVMAMLAAIAATLNGGATAPGGGGAITYTVPFTGVSPPSPVPIVSTTTKIL